jgi:ABC-2 type transport system permease protein
VSQFGALVRKARCHAANTGRIVRAQPPLKRAVVLFFAAGLEAGLFLLFRDGLRFLDSFGGVGSIIVGRLLAVFFLGMSAMLVASGIVSSYVTLFRSDEVPFLMVRPFHVADIAVYKSLQSAMLSSWAFFFVIVPFVAAFAWHLRLSPWFAVWTLLFSVPFLLLCSGVGTVLTMLIVRWFPRVRPARALVVVTLAGACAGAWWFLRSVYDPRADAAFDLARLVPGFRLASNPLLPGAWFAEGIMSLARGRWLRGILYWGMLATSAAMVTVAIDVLAAWTYDATWQRVWYSPSRTNRTAVMLPGLERLMRRFPPDVRAMIAKDVRVFLRDPMQWSQALVFFGLLGIYFANLRSFRYDILPGEWRTIIAFLNVFSVAAVVCSLGSRFIYPQLSLEGQGFWILGLSPTRMSRIVLTKFALSCAALLTVSMTLIWVSGGMLKTGPEERWVAAGIAAAIAVSVCGLSCGLGAAFLDLRERNPAAIVSGFGGTLNLVLGLCVMLASILPPALLFHLRSTGVIAPRLFRVALGWAVGGVVVLTAAAVALPLWVGVRSLNRRDF